MKEVKEVAKKKKGRWKSTLAQIAKSKSGNRMTDFTADEERS